MASPCLVVVPVPLTLYSLARISFRSFLDTVALFGWRTSMTYSRRSSSSSSTRRGAAESGARRRPAPVPTACTIPYHAIRSITLRMLLAYAPLLRHSRASLAVALVSARAAGRAAAAARAPTYHLLAVEQAVGEHLAGADGDRHGGAG